MRILIIFIILSCTHTSQPLEGSFFKNVKYIKNYDGDTVTFTIKEVHPLLGNMIPVRIRGIDAAELRTKNKCEKEVGTLTKNFVGNILKDASSIHLVNLERGKYFRIIADIIVDGKDLREIVLKNQLAYKYDGTTKKRINWCSQKSRIPTSFLP